MKNRCFEAFFLLLTVGLLLFGLAACAPVPQKAEILPVSSVNYNNYINGNLVDCRDGYLALYQYGVIRNTLAQGRIKGGTAWYEKTQNSSEAFVLDMDRFDCICLCCG